jgi:phospholipid/cholesterol/gamma-HCH transport system substrate-binding protein
VAIEIDGGSNHSKLLKSKNGEIPVIKSEPSWFSKTSKGLGNMAENLGVVLQRAEKLLNDKNMEAFGNILHNIDKMSVKALGTLDELNATFETYREMALQFNKNVEKAGSDFGRVADNTVPTLKSLKKAVKDFNRLTLEVEMSLNRGDYNIKETFEPMLVDIGILTEQLTDLTRELQQSPSSVLFKSRKRRRGPGE